MSFELSRLKLEIDLAKECIGLTKKLLECTILSEEDKSFVKKYDEFLPSYWAELTIKYQDEQTSVFNQMEMLSQEEFEAQLKQLNTQIKSESSNSQLQTLQLTRSKLITDYCTGKNNCWLRKREEKQLFERREQFYALLRTAFDAKTARHFAEHPLASTKLELEKLQKKYLGEFN